MICSIRLSGVIKGGSMLLKSVALSGALLAGTLFAAAPDDKLIFEFALEHESFSPADRILGTLRLMNRSDEPVAIVKPFFPSRWIIVGRVKRGGAVQENTWKGGTLRGTTHEDRGGMPYRDEEYARVAPRDSYSVQVDLGKYLPTEAGVILPGEYDVTFFYEYKVMSSEGHLPLIDQQLRSNSQRLRIKNGDG